MTICYRITNEKQKFLSISHRNYIAIFSGDYPFNFTSASFAKQSFENISESIVQHSINEDVDTRIQTNKTVGYRCQQNYRFLGSNKEKNTDC